MPAFVKDQVNGPEVARSNVMVVVGSFAHNILHPTMRNKGKRILAALYCVLIVTRKTRQDLITQV